MKIVVRNRVVIFIPVLVWLLLLQGSSISSAESTELEGQSITSQDLEPTDILEASDASFPLAQRPLRFHWDGTIEDFLFRMRDFQNQSREDMSPMELRFSMSYFSNPVAITTLSSDGSLIVAVLKMWYLRKLLEESNEKNTSNQDAIPELLNYRGLAIIYGNTPGGIDIFFLPRDPNLTPNQTYTATRSQYYFSAIIPKISHNLGFANLYDSEGVCDYLLSDYYGTEYNRHHALYWKRKPEHPGMIYQRYANLEEPHLAWYNIQHNEESKEMFSILKHSLDSFQLPRERAFAGIKTSGARLELPSSQLFSIYRTELPANSDSQVSLTASELVDALAEWDSIIMGAFALTDGRVQLLFFEAPHPADVVLE